MNIDDDDIIEMTDENGESYKVRIIDLTAVDGVEYAVLQPLNEDAAEYSGEDDEEEYVLMRLKKEGEEYSFETIDDDEEFERVSEYIDKLADEIED